MCTCRYSQDKHLKNYLVLTITNGKRTQFLLTDAVTYDIKNIKNKNYYNLKDIDMSILPIEKFIIQSEDVALLTDIFMGKKGNLVKFINFRQLNKKFERKCLNLRENVFKIDITPSFLLWIVR